MIKISLCENEVVTLVLKFNNHFIYIELINF